ILDPGRRLEAKRRIGLEDQRRRKFLLHKAAVHRAEIDRIDVGGGHSGIGERALYHLDDQRFDVAPVMLAEFRMRPPDDAPGHHDLHPLTAPTIASRRAALYPDMGILRGSNMADSPETLTIRRPDDWH